MLTRRQIFQRRRARGARRRSARARSRRFRKSCPTDIAAHAPPLAPPNGRPYHPVATLNGWIAAVANAQWRQGISPGGRARDSRDRARHDRRISGATTGDSRRADHRGGRGRPRAHIRHQPSDGAHQRPLARPASAQRHGRRRRAQSAGDQAGTDLRLRVRARSAPEPSCITRMRTRPRRWRWA